MIDTILIVAALICFIVAAIGDRVDVRGVNLVALGLFFWLLTTQVG